MSSAPDTKKAASRPLLEVGWILYGPLEEPDRQAVLAAREETLAALGAAFPHLEWRMPLLDRSSLRLENREEPMALLDFGASEREARHWDYAVVLTGADLVAHYRQYTYGVSSSALNVLVASTFRIDPEGQDEACSSERRVELMRRRVRALVLHLFGLLNGLSTHEEHEGWMGTVADATDFDRSGDLAPAARERLAEALVDSADLRIEEALLSESRSAIGFYLRAVWSSREEIASSLRHSRPWEFPLRLSRLTTAALSTLTLLMVTAEAWDLGISQSMSAVALLSLLSLLGTSFFVLKRQRLFVRPGPQGLTEQVATTNTSAALLVLGGMCATWLLLFGTSLITGYCFFEGSLLGDWTASTPQTVGNYERVLMAGFVAALGIVIGALGATFENQQDFRHVALVDVEV